MTSQFVGLCGLLCALPLLVAATPPRGAAYSLKAAVDELHRRELAKYPLNAPPSAGAASSSSHYFGGDLDSDWDEDSDLFGTGSGGKYSNRNRHSINKALAKYLERENYEADHGGLSLGPFGGYEFDAEPSNSNNDNLVTDEKRKRMSSFRERDDYENGPPAATSVFRERESKANVNGDSHSELTEQFLREIEEASELERQDRYKAALRQMWEKYQQQENEIGDNDELFEQKKRMRMPPYYLLMQKKRSSYPVLPWLPYNADKEKKKRFPVAKRSAKRSAGELMPLVKTDEKVAQELSELFGKPEGDDKKKRSTDEQLKNGATTHLPETAATATATALGDMRLEINFQRVNLSSNEGEAAAKEAATIATGGGAGEMIQHMHAGHHEHQTGAEKEHKHRKRSDHVHHSSHESHEESEEARADEHDEEGEESSDEDRSEEFDEDEEADAEERRKKKKRDASAKHSVGHLMLRAKKSIDWSQYFGLDLDRKKKSPQLPAEAEEKKRNEEQQEEEAQKKKRDIDPEKLDSMDKKLQSIEDFIIDETIKYTGAHEGISNQDEIRKLKDHVLSRLATAYSLEKMRRALDKLRQSVENENHLLRNAIEPESEENALDGTYWPNHKRYSVKKEQAIEEADGDSDGNRKKQKRGYLRYPEQPNAMEEALTNAPYESHNDAYLGNKNYIIGSNQCPMIESMAERCRGVDLIAGDLSQELLPLCGVHQICYLCGASQVACDYQYLAEADGICGANNDCQAAARSVLMILRGTPGPQLGPRECLKNPCLYSAMREIGL